ncbi:MAG: OmpA family protein [Microbacter sp.]
MHIYAQSMNNMFSFHTFCKLNRKQNRFRSLSIVLSIILLFPPMLLPAQKKQASPTPSAESILSNSSTAGKSASIAIVGYVKDVQKMTPWEGATVFLYNKLNHKIYVTKTNHDGKYIFHVNPPCDGIIKAMDHNTFNDCMTFESNSSASDSIQPVDRDLLLERVQMDKDWRFRNIYYDSGKWEPRSDDYPILDSIVNVMNLYPIKIKVSSHTDAFGSDDYNERLSQLRAETVAKYFINKGIASDRIIAKGYGSRFLLFVPRVGVPCTEAENQENRRTEFKMIGFISFEKNIEPFDPAQWHDGEVISVPSPLSQQINFSPCASSASFEITTQTLHPKLRSSFSKDSMAILPFQGAVIQISAFKNKKYALNLYQKAVERTGKHTLILIEDHFYKVRLDGFQSEREARLFVNRLHQLGFNATYLPILPPYFSIKIGSFDDESNARAAQHEMEKQTRHAVTIEYDPPYFYLNVNDFKTKTDAENTIQILK